MPLSVCVSPAFIQLRNCVSLSRPRWQRGKQLTALLPALPSPGYFLYLRRTSSKELFSVVEGAGQEREGPRPPGPEVFRGVSPFHSSTLVLRQLDCSWEPRGSLKD